MDNLISGLPTPQVTLEGREPGEANAPKDLVALLGDIFGAKNVKCAEKRAAEGEEHRGEKGAIEIFDLDFNGLPVTLEQFSTLFNAFGPEGGTPLTEILFFEGVPSRLAIDRKAAEAALDKQQSSPNGDRLLRQQASLRGSWKR